MNAILKPSPNETSRMMHDEFQRRRQARILQVREQDKLIAIRIRRAMQDKQRREMENLTNVLQKEWMQKHQEALKRSEEKFASGLKDVGKAHEEAKENAPNQALMDALHEQMRKRANERGRSAMQHQKEVKKKEEEESMVLRKKRHIAMIKEKLRARHIANLPPPMANPADTFLDNTVATTGSESWSSGSIPHHPQRYTTIEIKDHNSTMPTTVSLGQPSDVIVERATVAESAADARKDAEIEGERISLLQAERDREVQERMEKAKVRHQAALEKARLDKEGKSLMDELKQMKMKDAQRRQYHIDYKCKDSSRMQQACNELFRPVGIPDSELLSSDLLDRAHEESSSDEQDDTDDNDFPRRRLHPLVEEDEESTGEGSEPPQNSEPPVKGRALGKLLKQIELQRQQRKKNRTDQRRDEMPSMPESLNGISSIARDKSEEISSSTSPEDSLDEAPISPKVPSPQKVTKPRDVAPPLPKPQLPKTTDSRDHIPASIPEVTVPKTITSTMPSFTLPTSLGSQLRPTYPKTTYPVPSDSSQVSSESVLVKSLESVRNDDALLKSVKDFQQRILQQHKSYAKIQQQIERLQEKKANLDGIVSNITKPKTFQVSGQKN